MKLLKNSALFSLLYTSAHIEADQYGIHNSEEDDDKDSTMADIMSPSQDAVWRRSL